MADGSLQGGLVVCTRWRLCGRLSVLASPSARVWEAENIATHARVAIKFLARPAAADAGARRRFEREIRAISKVRSPHVLPVIDHGHTESGLPFVVTELLKGHDLGHVLASAPVLGLIETQLIVDQVCRGLSTFHAAGLAHRDLRPENVFLRSSRRSRASVRLLGFGLANTLASQSTQLAPDGTVIGMSPLLSPEQLQSPPRADARTDLWALGVLAYRMLSGVWPFDRRNWATLASSIESAAFMPVSARRKDLPAELDRWFERTIQPEPARRYATVEQARAEFERIATVYTSGMLAQLRPDQPTLAEAPRSASIIVGPPSSRRDPGSSWRIAVWGLVLIGLSCFALRAPLTRWIGGTLDAPPFMVRQLSSRAALAPLRVLPANANLSTAVVAAPQPMAASETLLMSPPPAAALPAVQPSVESKQASVPRPRIVRPSGLAAEVLRDPPPEPRPHVARAVSLLNDPSPDLPAPNHVYRGF